MKAVVIAMTSFAAALLLAGLIVGFGVGVSTDSGFDCGSAFHESSDLMSDELFDTMTGGNGESGCDAARGSAKPLPIVLIVLGVAVGFGALVARSVDATDREAASSI